MRTIRVFLFLTAAAALAGCGGSGSVPTIDESPLTVEQWKALPPGEKYEVPAFERLKAGEPKLQDQKEWDRFTREVLLPAKKKDRAAGKLKS